MQGIRYKMPEPQAFRGFIEGVQNLQDYLRTNSSDRLDDAEEQFNESLAVDPDFVAAQYYKAIVLTHARKADEAIEILESLNREEVPFKTEVLYNLAFAYGKTYSYQKVELALKAITEAEKLAIDQHREDLRLLVTAMKAWVMAVFGAYPFDHPEDFELRQKKYLPKAVSVAESVLEDPALETLASETRLAVMVEANGAAGGALMYMGLYPARFDKNTDYWDRAQKYYSAALRLHPRNVRVLDDLATLQLMRACRAIEQKRLDEARDFAVSARDTELRALSYHQHDRFRFQLLSNIYALLGEWDEAEDAAEQILKEPGVPTKERVEELKRYIQDRNIGPILKRYGQKKD